MIVIEKDVMVSMADGVRCTFEITMRTTDFGLAARCRG